MTATEKMQFLQSRNQAITRLGIPAYDWDTEVLHGIFSSRGNFPKSMPVQPTILPNGIGLAASFDLDLVHRCAALIGTEQRALNNQLMSLKDPHSSLAETGQYQGINGYAPNCNLYRDARWGRAQVSGLQV
jgi:beta-glucosidase